LTLISEDLQHTHIAMLQSISGKNIYTDESIAMNTAQTNFVGGIVYKKVLFLDFNSYFHCIVGEAH
jgi:hypothetical protein